MKTINLVLIAIASHVLFFLTISAIGSLWSSYLAVITNPGWFFVYTVFFGWLAALPTREYYLKNKADFDLIF